jgi:hypothetical protein
MVHELAVTGSQTSEAEDSKDDTYKQEPNAYTKHKKDANQFNPGESFSP